MAFVTIAGMWTMDPVNVWQPKSSFFLNDPFGIAMHVMNSADLVRQRVIFAVRFELVNPIDDPKDHNVWWQAYDDGPELRTTVDFHFDNLRTEFTDHAWFLDFGSYKNAVAHVGAGSFPGVFAVRGSIRVLGTDLFDLTPPFAFKYQLRD